MSCNKSKQGRKRYCLSDFRHRIVILKGEIVSTEDEYTVSNDMTVLTCRAKLKTTGGSSFYNGVSITDNPTHKFTIPFVKNIPIEKNYIIELRSEYYSIENIINENEDNLYLIITANKRGSKEQKANWR